MVIIDSLGAELVDVLWRVAVFGVIFGLLYRRSVLSVFDPLNIFILSQVCASALATLLVHDAAVLCQFFAAQAAFYAGFRLNRRTAAKPFVPCWTAARVEVAEIAIGALFLAWLAAQLYLVATAGAPLFASSASQAKVQTFRDGLGFIKRLNGGVGLLAPAGALVLALRGAHRRLFGAIFIASALVSSLDGSKGALLPFLFLIGYAVKRPGLLPKAYLRRIQIGAAVLVVCAIALALFVLAGDQGDLGTAVLALFGRVLCYGDVVIYYYQPDMMHYLSGLGPLDFVASELNSILGEFRLADYQQPLGVLMVTHSLGNETLATLFGPNTQFFVRGQIYFGSIVGTLYAGAVGWVVGRVRRGFFEIDGEHPVALIAALTMAVRIFTLPVESPYFVGLVFDTFVPLILILAIASVVQLAGSGYPSGMSAPAAAGAER